MKNQITSRDIQRNNFVNHLYNSLRKKTSKAINEHRKIARKAAEYLNDGLEENECVELLIMDGINRKAAIEYVEMAKGDYEDGLNEYSFTFEDSFGRLVSSHDIHSFIKASSNEEAWEKAEQFLDDNVDYDAERIVSVEKVD